MVFRSLLQQSSCSSASTPSTSYEQVVPLRRLWRRPARVARHSSVSTPRDALTEPSVASVPGGLFRDPTSNQQHLDSSTAQRWAHAAAATAATTTTYSTSSYSTDEDAGCPQAAMDGCEAVARIAYMLTNVSFIYPITPSTAMSELTEAWASEGKRNVFGNVVTVTEMEGEGGVAGALHGAVAAGALACSFTASQGLLLMIPNMYKIAGELAPCVLHVASRAVAKQAVTMYGDHSDVMGVRQTGWAMLCSNSVQEAQDMALVAHLATLRSSVPFLHFFDGFRTSHEINKICTLSEADVRRLVSQPVYRDAIWRLEQQALNPTHPHQRGTVQGSDVFFQALEAASPSFRACPGHVLAAMSDLASVSGRSYSLFEYVGHPEAEAVVVMMGSGCQVAEEAVKHLTAQGQHVGLLKVRLYRPWSAEHLVAALPPSATRIAVLDRTKESGSAGEPLFLDVMSALAEHDDTHPTAARRTVIGGRYGIASKDFTPAMVAAVFANLAVPAPKRRFTLGIIDDVSHSHLPLGPELHTLPRGTRQCLFWGLGSDGTVGANKDAVKIISDNTDLFAQAYFAYDAHKSGGLTISHLRFSPEPIGSSYLIKQADYLAVHHASYMQRYDVLPNLRPGGILVLNTKCATAAELDKFLPTMVKRQLAQLQPSLYVIDAQGVAKSLGLGHHVNMVMQTVFFHLCGVLPMDKALALLKESIAKTYESKGPEVVACNQAAVDLTIQQLVRLPLPDAWAALPAQPPLLPAGASVAGAVAGHAPGADRLHFIEEVARPMLSLKGDTLPVSVFSPAGIVPPGITSIKRRAIAATVPTWQGAQCSQCNVCAFVCPHAAIRPFLASPEELHAAPDAFSTIKARGQGTLGYQYRIQVSPYDCTGCQLCVTACPDKALAAMPLDDVRDVEDRNWAFGSALPARSDLVSRATVKGSQFMTPLLEFNGACEGCGEPAYVKLLTQLFGERLIIANGTGCSSVWGGHMPSNPFTTNAAGHGPAWANSLFEDNAQFGLGIAMAVIQRRRTLHRHVKEALALGDALPMSAELRATLHDWAKSWKTVEPCNTLAARASALLDAERGSHAELELLWHERDQLVKPSIWIVGGDGWAYDIGFGGLDHLFSTGEDVNVLVLDNELYANTGGQKSKATPLGAVAKFAAGGKDRPKKDLGAIAMTYGDVYVASTNLEANYGQVVKAIAEAEHYHGVSLVLGYVPCIAHGIEKGMCGALTDAKEATSSSYWPLYRYNPAAIDNGLQHRFKLDSRRVTDDLEHFTALEQRFGRLARAHPHTAHRLQHDLDLMNHERHDRLKHLAEEDCAPPPHGMLQLEALDKAEAKQQAASEQ